MEKSSFISDIRKITQYLREQTLSLTRNNYLLECLLSNKSIVFDDMQDWYFEQWCGKYCNNMDTKICIVIRDKILLKRMTHLTSIKSNELTNEQVLLKVLMNSCALQSLSFDNGRITDNFVDNIINSLTHNSQLRKLNFEEKYSYPIFSTLNSALKHNQCLEYLYILANDWNLSAVTNLDFLHFNQTLTNLKIGTPRISNIVQICQSLRFNPSLEHIYLVYVNIGYNQISVADAHIFENIFAYSHLKTFELSNVNLEAIGTYSWGFENNQSLTEFTLEYCKFSDLSGLIGALQFNQNLSHLTIADIGTQSIAPKLAEVLVQNQSLKYLDMKQYSYPFPTKPAHTYRPIFQALCRNAHLECLHITCSKIDQETALDIGSMLSCQSALNTLELNTDTDTNYYIDILSPLAHNNILTNITLFFNIQEKDESKFEALSEQIFKRNAALSMFYFHYQSYAYDTWIPYIKRNNKNRRLILNLRTQAALTYFKSHSQNLSLDITKIQESIPEECIHELKAIQKQIDSIFNDN